MFCREQVARLLERKAAFADAGARLVAVGNGTVNFAQGFVDEMAEAHGSFELELYTDPGRKAFQSFGFKRDRLTLFKPSVFKNARRAIDSGAFQTGVKGDAWQNGGVAVVTPDGTLRYLHVEQASGDHADVDEVLAALPR